MQVDDEEQEMIPAVSSIVKPADFSPERSVFLHLSISHAVDMHTSYHRQPQL